MIISIVLLAFICEYMEASLGMGYGTALAPILLLLGFSVIQIVPAVLLSELCASSLGAFFHHKSGNVNFKPRSTDIKEISAQLNSLGYVESFKRNLPLHLKVAILLGSCGIFGSIAAVFIATNIPHFWLQIYVGIAVLTAGICVLILKNANFKFSVKKIVALGLIASFNKGMSGGGYGPLVTSGQILSGLESKNAIGITALAKGFTCMIAILVYAFVLKADFYWQLALWLMVGATLAIPLSVYCVRRVGKKTLTTIIAVFSMTLGTITILKTFFELK